MPDFIPQPDDEFNSFLSALNTFVTDNFTLLDLTAAQQAALADVFTAWEPAWDDWQAIQNHYNALLAAKNQARAAATLVIRQINAAVQASRTVTDTTREAAGLPVYKTTRTPAPAILTRPVLYRVDNQHLLQRLWFSDQATPDSKAKPRGADFCEIRQAIVAPGDPAPTDPNAMPFLALNSKSPYRTEFDAGDVGKTAYYCQRWGKAGAAPGPWGVITNYLVT